MLSSEYIHEKILNTASCSGEDVRKLAELMELYPYVSSFPILYLKALANSKDVRLESEIEKYAYRISSRAVLFELLHPRFEVEIAPESQSLIQEEIEKPVLETIAIDEEIIPEVQAEIDEEVEDTVSETIEVEKEIIPKVQTNTTLALVAVKILLFLEQIATENGNTNYFNAEKFGSKKIKNVMGKGEKFSGYLFTHGVIECSTFFRIKGC
jgi:hypothetical protein